MTGVAGVDGGTIVSKSLRAERRVAGRGRQGRWSRRGVAAVLAMMFLILFGSLSVAMAIASKGNITTAATHLHVSRAQSAAETGLSIARARLEEAAARFLISGSDVNGTFGWRLWTGDLASLGQYTVLPSATGRIDVAAPDSLSRALADAHALDQDTVPSAGISAPTIGNAMANAQNGVYAESYWVYTPVVALEQRASGMTEPPLAYSVVYAPLANGTDIRAIVTGYDFGYTRNGQPITRTVMQDFRLSKRVNHAIISPSRIMIGKNVLVSGDLGARYTSVNFTDGDPLILRSDFAGLHAGLDQKLNDFFAQLRNFDVDGDNRLRAGHPTESQGIPAGTADYDGDGNPDDAFADVTGDGYVDEFDIFIKHWDTNGDGRLVLPADLTAGTAAAGSTPEFVADPDLALLIDSSIPDRNRNGIYGFIDANSNGRWDAGETMLDFDSAQNVNRDQVLGYRDGYIDRRDQYAKVNGSLSFKVDRAAWESAQGVLQPKLRGPIRPDSGGAPLSFSVSDESLPDLSAGAFSNSRNGLQAAADGAAFANQVATQLGISVGQLATYVESQPAGPGQPRFERLDPDVNLDGRPDNWQTAYFEKMPFNSPNYSDWYYRPVYENMVFRDVQIPAGTNALFRNCTFVGVTWIRCETTNTHVLWGEYGKMTLDGATGRPKPATARFVYGDDAGETNYPPVLPSSATPPNQMVLIANQPMDKGDITSDQVAIVQGYNLLPEPLIIGGRRVTDTRSHSNNIRFHDCLFVGSVVSDSPSSYTQSRNKLQFTGSTRFVSEHPTSPDDASMNPESVDKEEIAKSSMMLPNYSVDIGSFNSPETQDIRLRGAIIAGVLDVRGNADIDGALLLTFAPQHGQYPLVDALGNPIGNPAGFNASIGYFGPDDGDAESLDPNTLPVVGGQRIVGWDTNGDGLADVSHTQPQPNGSTPVPFHGYGRINLRFDPKMVLPDGIMLPMQFDPVAGSYREGKP